MTFVLRQDIKPAAEGNSNACTALTTKTQTEIQKSQKLYGLSDLAFYIVSFVSSLRFCDQTA
jgi:hypothetical protein